MDYKDVQKIKIMLFYLGNLGLHQSFHSEDHFMGIMELVNILPMT